jgi:hypothetical protein
MKEDGFKKIWELNPNATEPFKANVTLDGVYAKYYQFLKEAYKKDSINIDQLNKHIIEIGLINIMKDIWAMLLSSVVESFETPEKH